jgi:hypothetical protein
MFSLNLDINLIGRKYAQYKGQRHSAERLARYDVLLRPLVYTIRTQLFSQS